MATVTYTAASVMSRSPEALLSFTASAAKNLIPCAKQRRIAHHSLPSLPEFIATMFRRTQLPTTVYLVSLIYLNKLKARLPSCARGDFDTPYKLFLAAILVASKFTSECGTALTSYQLSQMTDGLYSPKEINLMERSFLGLLKYELWVDLEMVKDFLLRFGDKLEMEIHESVVAEC